jgi:tetratricopeptide (TPR) repeat protein
MIVGMRFCRSGVLFVLLGSCASVSTDPDVLWGSTWPGGAGQDPAKREQAKAALTALRYAPREEDRIIWYGRRLAYLGLYQDAIDVYSIGLTVHPNSPKLLRHRGHRYISTRRFAEAVADFERARTLIEGEPDEVEPDGQPNARNIPTSSLHTNIWYHLGLARYCRGEFERALWCYERCLLAAKNQDMEAATRYWVFLAATRVGDSAKAKAALEPVRADWDIIENHAYHHLLLLYRGDRKRDSLKTPSGDAIQGKTLEYGLARHLFLIGEPARGQEALQRVASGKSPAFGSIAAEADLR